MELRREFIERWLKKDAPPVTVLAASFGISEKTAHKWLSRFRDGGMASLEDRSRRPLSSPSATPEHVRELLVGLRREHPTWGPKKLLAVLARQRPSLALPAASTAGAILKQAGLVTPGRPRRRTLPKTVNRLQVPAEPNDVWCIDFKGHFNIGGKPCHPLTLTDAFSRYLLLCKALPSTGGPAVRTHLEAALREYGLPRYVRSDNGRPFGGGKLAGLSSLSVFLIRLGVRVEFIDPGKPQQNGQHERMHRTLKHEAIVAPGSTWNAQQRAFNRFQREFNDDRPHEALGMRRPSDVYRRSPRPLPNRLPELEYPSGHVLRRVHSHGQIRWRGRELFLSETLIGQTVGLRESHIDGWWHLEFGPVHLGYIDPQGRILPQKRPVWTSDEGSPMSPV